MVALYTTHRVRSALLFACDIKARKGDDRGIRSRRYCDGFLHDIHRYLASCSCSCVCARFSTEEIQSYFGFKNARARDEGSPK